MVAGRSFYSCFARAFAASPPSPSIHSRCCRQYHKTLQNASRVRSQPSDRRPFSSSSAHLKSNTVEELQSQYRTGPFSIAAASFFVVCGIGMYWYFEREKNRMVRKRIRDASKGVGKPRIGGDFALIDQNGRPFTSEDLKGKFALVYFGFTNCPDICPDELDKMAKMIDLITSKRGEVLLPIFVTCDPARDTPEVIKDYLSEFHPKMIGLTGTWEQIKAMCKAYRVYFSTPPHVKPGQDYLVDHSIYFYLMDPDTDFIEVIGREHTAERGAKVATDHIDKYLGRSTDKESYKEVRVVRDKEIQRARAGRAVKHNEDVD